MSMKRLTYLALLIAHTLAATEATAAPITVPSGLSAGDTYRLAFVTSTTRDAASTNINDYNAFVSGVAAGVPELAALGTTWKAIGSTASVDARDNTGTNPLVSSGVPVYTLGDALVADGNVTLWQLPVHNVDRDERGNESPEFGDNFVFTGTGLDGTVAAGAFRVALGDSFTAFGATWGDDASTWMYYAATRDVQHYLYGMSGILTVVPEPSTFALAAIGAVALMIARKRQRSAWSGIHSASHQ
jgi:hypothetical protein